MDLNLRAYNAMCLYIECAYIKIPFIDSGAINFTYAY